MTGLAWGVLVGAAMALHALFLTSAIAWARVLGVGVEQLTLGGGPVVASRDVAGVEVQLGALVPLSASVRYLGMEADPEDDTPDPGAQPSRIGPRRFRESGRLRRAALILGPWAVVLAVGAALVGLAEAPGALARVLETLVRGALSPLEVGRATVTLWAEWIAAGRWTDALGRFVMAVAVVNLAPWPPMALGQALVELRDRGAPPASLMVLGALLGFALALCWGVALIAATL